MPTKTLHRTRVSYNIRHIYIPGVTGCTFSWRATADVGDLRRPDNRTAYYIIIYYITHHVDQRGAERTREAASRRYILYKTLKPCTRTHTHKHTYLCITSVYFRGIRARARVYARLRIIISDLGTQVYLYRYTRLYVSSAHQCAAKKKKTRFTIECK